MVTWDSYLASIHKEYAQWWHLYTLTDVEDRKRKQQQATPMLFDFGLMVQTIKSQQPQTDLVVWIIIPLTCRESGVGSRESGVGVRRKFTVPRQYDKRYKSDAARSWGFPP
ncbi:hypothetical protein BJP34_18790 [Moorena producens PAL-8-15-08-1]|uniref:Uncharacterized protein n=1 Tax=Moorena producens PAL-8-15-08-1 TaxID=1458985 RepID=A0A1D8TU84_9CYAN|nr:hypothetical protein [Moorena producens]AOX01212.1 hypothetical protein BJP34_18790 [Moorena producens PAL-8-15-08-1]